MHATVKKLANTAKRNMRSLLRTRGYYFASDLLNERPEFQEFVVIHELLHLRIPNHGKLFESTLKAHFPDGAALFNNLRGRTLSS